MPLSSAERVAAYRARKREAGEPDATRRNRKAERKAWKARRTPPVKPFVGCDGEGCGVDELGRQNYMLFRMGSRELYTGQRLTSEQCLDFICNEPGGTILVGFAFGYDVTMILRDLPASQQKRLFDPIDFSPGHSRYTWYKNFDIEYLPKNYLKVRRVNVVRNDDGSERRGPVKGSQRVIYETFGFFQKSFLKVLKEFSIATEDALKIIATNKDARADFSEMTPEVRGYCALECEYLARLMETLRGYCDDADIHPRTWSGAGKLAAALHAKHGTPKSKEALANVPIEVEAMANMAYYGGRFEITRVGKIKGPIYEYDIKSAYPAAMPRLPCLIHGEWQSFERDQLPKPGSVYVANVSFRQSVAPDEETGALGGLPIRSKEGHLYWPLQGSGTYWNCEIDSARRLGAKITVHNGWSFSTSCHCTPFDWVEELFDYRMAIGGSGPGYPIKLGLNSLYGKLAQRKGNGQFANMIWAGLITAMTRAKLNDAIATNPRRIVMVAADAVYSLDPLPDLELGNWLGAWEREELAELFIVQPGLYWDPTKRKRKSRGLSGRFFEEDGRTEAFESAWETFRQSENSALDTIFPAVTVPVPGFIGLKLAVSRGKPETAGRWISDTRSISFDYRNKRVSHIWDDGAIITKPKAGGRTVLSIPHRDFLAAGGNEFWEASRLVMDEQPDYIDLSIPWKD